MQRPCKGPVWGGVPLRILWVTLRTCIPSSPSEDDGGSHGTKKKNRKVSDLVQFLGKGVTFENVYLSSLANTVHIHDTLTYIHTTQYMEPLLRM